MIDAVVQYVMLFRYSAVDPDLAQSAASRLLRPGGVAARAHVGKPEDHRGLVLAAGAHRRSPLRC